MGRWSVMIVLSRRGVAEPPSIRAASGEPAEELRGVDRLAHRVAPRLAVLQGDESRTGLRLGRHDLEGLPQDLGALSCRGSPTTPRRRRGPRSPRRVRRRPRRRRPRPGRCSPTGRALETVGSGLPLAGDERAGGGCDVRHVPPLMRWDSKRIANRLRAAGCTASPGTRWSPLPARVLRALGEGTVQGKEDHGGFSPVVFFPPGCRGRPGAVRRICGGLCEGGAVPRQG